jgi:hypothetical protein
MRQTNCKQYAFSVDFKERAVFNRAVEANGVSAVKEIRRMVDDFLRDQSRYSEMMKSPKVKKAQEFPIKEVRINAHFDDLALRRFTVICQYANVIVGYMLREMIVTYAQEHSFTCNL